MLIFLALIQSVEDIRMQQLLSSGDGLTICHDPLNLFLLGTMFLRKAVFSYFQYEYCHTIL